ncbi:MAG: 30S ribosomal protein S8 [Chlorobi bacterium]|nr:30S ribosomal protein S8 [Chlorobiota bacterium]MCI0714905.1 30S ribosomal protein S8 [Chlorobiota bacterium]
MNTDPISDYLTRIRNAQKAKRKTVEIPASKLKLKITEILNKQGFVSDFNVVETPNKQGNIVIKLKYNDGEGVILGLERVSRPGIRRYVRNNEIPKVLNGLGVAIVSTSKGLMTDKEARKLGVGGEVICNVW